MRVIGFALLGFFAGAAAGFVLATVFIFLWYDVLAIGQQGGDGMSGLAAYLVLTPALGLIGGIAGAIWLGRSAGAGDGGKSSPALVVGAVVAILGALAFFLVSGMFL